MAIGPRSVPAGPLGLESERSEGQRHEQGRHEHRRQPLTRGEDDCVDRPGARSVRTRSSSRPNSRIAPRAESPKRATKPDDSPEGQHPAEQRHGHRRADEGEQGRGQDQGGRSSVEGDGEQAEHPEEGEHIVDQQIVPRRHGGLVGAAVFDERPCGQSHPLADGPPRRVGKLDGIGRAGGDHLAAQAVVVRDHRPIVGQVDIGDRLQRQGDAGRRSQQQVSNSFGVEPQRVLRADGEVDHPASLVDPGDALAGKGGLHGVENIGGRKAEEGQALEVDVDPDHRGAALVFDANVPGSGQAAQHGGDPVGRVVQSVEILAKHRHLDRRGRSATALRAVEPRLHGCGEAGKAPKSRQHPPGQPLLLANVHQRRQLEVEAAAFGAPATFSRGVTADPLADRPHAGQRCQRGRDALAIVA